MQSKNIFVQSIAIGVFFLCTYIHTAHFAQYKLMTISIFHSSKNFGLSSVEWEPLTFMKIKVDHWVGPQYLAYARLLASDMVNCAYKYYNIVHVYIIFFSVLAQRGYFKDPTFVNYLKYLQYWKEPKYAKYLK